MIRLIILFNLTEADVEDRMGRYTRLSDKSIIEKIKIFILNMFFRIEE